MSMAPVNACDGELEIEDKISAASTEPSPSLERATQRLRHGSWRPSREQPLDIHPL
jgi:hypothetical protein